MSGFNFLWTSFEPHRSKGVQFQDVSFQLQLFNVLSQIPATLMVKYKKTIALKTEERKFVLIQRTRSSSVSYCFHGTLILLICGKVKLFFGYERKYFNERNSVLIFLVWHRVSGALYFLFHLYCSINKVTHTKKKMQIILDIWFSDKYYFKVSVGFFSFMVQCICSIHAFIFF